MATLQNLGVLKYRDKDGNWKPLPVVLQSSGGGGSGGISTISGKGKPTESTVGRLNQLYRDEDTQRLYICTAADGGYTWAAVSGGSVDVDATLTKAGYAADAKAAGDAIGGKIDKAQGAENAGKVLGVDEEGNVVPEDKPVQALAGSAAPTAATAGVVGQEYYVIVDNAVTEMYVCTSALIGSYTWDKVEFGGGYTLPTASSTTLGGVKPIAKTDAMTQSVGVDDAGALWTAAGGESGGMRVIKTITITADDINSIYFNQDNDGNPFLLTKHIRIFMYGAESNTGATQATLFFRGGDTNLGNVSQSSYPIRINSQGQINYVFGLILDIYAASNMWYGDFASGKNVSAQMYRYVSGAAMERNTISEIKILWNLSNVYFPNGSTIVVEGE